MLKGLDRALRGRGASARVSDAGAMGRVSLRGLGPIETTMLIALPELDGAASPTVYGGRHGAGGLFGLRAWPAKAVHIGRQGRWHPCFERIEVFAARMKTLRLVSRLRRQTVARSQGRYRPLFGFPAECGRGGDGRISERICVSFHATLRSDEGSKATDVEGAGERRGVARATVLGGNSAEAIWAGRERRCARGCRQTGSYRRDSPGWTRSKQPMGTGAGKAFSRMGKGRVHPWPPQLGNVFVGLQPAFGYEGDPMRLSVREGASRRRHAFVQFYLWLRNTFGADALYCISGCTGRWSLCRGSRRGLVRGDLARSADRRDAERLSLCGEQSVGSHALAKRRSKRRRNGVASDAASGDGRALQRVGRS